MISFIQQFKNFKIKLHTHTIVIKVTTNILKRFGERGLFKKSWQVIELILGKNTNIFLIQYLELIL